MRKINYLSQGQSADIAAIDTAGDAYQINQSGFTAHQIAFRKPSGAIIKRTATVGTTQATIGAHTAPAGSWARYTIAGDDLNETGVWQAQLIWTDNDKNSGSLGWQTIFEVVAGSRASC